MNYANFFRRFVAALLDGVFVGIISLFLNRLGIIGMIFGIVLGFLYYPFFWSSAARATPGKYLLGLSVQTLSGERITLKTAIIRYVCTFISGILLCCGYILALFTEKKQTLHDLLAGTVVIDEAFTPEEGLIQAWLDQIKSIK